MDLLTADQSERSADVELELEYEIEEDIEAELDNFVRLNHTGQFEDAHELFDECLSSHNDWYPIAAEYADCLLREGKFKQLADFSRKASMTFRDPSEKMLLLLMGVIANLAPRDVMRQQLQALWPVDGLKSPYTSLRDTDIHILELVLLALVLTGLEPKDFEASLPSDSTSVGPWSVFKDFFYYLLHNRLFWEAQRILQTLIHTVSLPESQTMVHDYIEEAVSTNIGDDSVQIAVSSLVQRFLYVTKSKRSSPLAVVSWNEAITWALFGVTLAEKGEDSTSLFNRIFLRRSLEEELAPGLCITLPLNGVQGNDEVSDSLYEAVSNGDASMMRQAMIIAPTHYRWDEVNSMALLKAAQRGSEMNVLKFLSPDTVHTRDGYQRTVFHWAALKCDWRTIEILLMQGKADPCSLDWFGCTPLHYAVQTLQDRAAYLLLDFDAATVNTKDMSGLGPLHTAILDESPGIAILLVENGATMGTGNIGALPPFDIGNVDWDSKYSLYQTRLASFQPSDLALTGAKSGSRKISSSGHFGLLGQHTRQKYPPTNTPDCIPPCNTLYVGKLPVEPSEDELRDLFSKQRGYKRLSLRTTQRGIKCFVEFEDVSFATKALNELDGHSLHNSMKEGIRLTQFGFVLFPS